MSDYFLHASVKWGHCALGVGCIFILGPLCSYMVTTYALAFVNIKRIHISCLRGFWEVKEHI